MISLENLVEHDSLLCCYNLELFKESGALGLRHCGAVDFIIFIDQLLELHEL